MFLLFVTTRFYLYFISSMYKLEITNIIYIYSTDKGGHVAWLEGNGFTSKLRLWYI